MSQYYKFADLKAIFPFFHEWDKINDKKQKYQERKMRIFMRGVKIGVKRTGGIEAGMSLFDQKKKDAATGQKVGE